MRYHSHCLKPFTSCWLHCFSHSCGFIIVITGTYGGCGLRHITSFSISSYDLQKPVMSTTCDKISSSCVHVSWTPRVSVCMLAGECEFESSSCVSFSLPLRDLPEATVDPWPGINNWNILELWPLPPPLLPPPGITSDQLAYSLPSLCFQLPSIVSMGFI